METRERGRRERGKALEIWESRRVDVETGSGIRIADPGNLMGKGEEELEREREIDRELQREIQRERKRREKKVKIFDGFGARGQAEFETTTRIEAGGSSDTARVGSLWRERS